MNCDRCGKKIRYGTLCHDCNIYLESYCKGLRQGRKEGYIKALEDLWKLSIYKFDEFLDLEDLQELISELKNKQN